MALAETTVNKVNNYNRTNDNVISVKSDSGIFITGLGNHSATCVLLETGATVSVLSESTSEKSGPVPQLKLLKEH